MQIYKNLDKWASFMVTITFLFVSYARYHPKINKKQKQTIHKNK